MRGFLNLMIVHQLWVSWFFISTVWWLSRLTCTNHLFVRRAFWIHPWTLLIVSLRTWIRILFCGAKKWVQCCLLTLLLVNVILNLLRIFSDNILSSKSWSNRFKQISVIPTGLKAPKTLIVDERMKYLSFLLHVFLLWHTEWNESSWWSLLLVWVEIDWNGDHPKIRLGWLSSRLSWFSWFRRCRRLRLSSESSRRSRSCSGSEEGS